MRRLNVHRIRLMLAVSIAAIVLGGIEPANAASIEVGSGQGSDFDNIQAGIDAAVDGDTVLVAPGEYDITEPITFRGKAITVCSEAGPDETIIRMGTPVDTNRGSVVIFENGETIASVLDGFTITEGKGSWLEDRWGGGGILLLNASSATVINCAIVQNSAESAGGVGCIDNSSIAMSNCNVRGNIATGTTWFVNGYGGALVCSRSSSMTIDNCTFGENSAGVGGGVLFINYGSSVTMTNCVMNGNMAHGWGGAIQCLQASTVLTNCVIASNYAGINHGSLLVEATYAGMRKDSSLIITNCTIWGNSAGEKESGISCVTGASATIKNSIIRENTATGGPEIRIELDSSILSIAYSNIAGGQSRASVKDGTLNWGMGNIDADPLFAEPNNDDFHLKSEAGRWNPTSQIWVLDDVSSPCIDAGDPNSSVAFEPYPNGDIINMGAYGGTAEASKSPSGLHSRYGGGTGEPNDPYLIYATEHLNALGIEPNDYDKHFKLMADIDLSRYTYDRAVIAPDTNDVEPDFQGLPFKGVFDGNGHTISHLTIEGGGYLGLFGLLTDSGATISNLGLEAVDVSGTGDNVGGLVGSNGHGDSFVRGGSITASYSTGTVSGGGTVGGLVGENYEGTITASYSTCSVSGGLHVGGLVGGNNEGSITSSYSMGTVTGESAAGLVCTNFRGWITMCYSTSAVTGRDRIVSGPLFGFSWGGTFTSCFWDMETSGLGGGVGRTGLTTAEMQTTNTFIKAGWDFVGETENGTEDIWKMWDGYDYPRLAWEPGPNMPLVFVDINDPGFYGQMSRYEVTNAQYCDFLNAALASGDITMESALNPRWHGYHVIGVSGSNPGIDYAGVMYYNGNGSGWSGFNGVTNGGAARIHYSAGAFHVDSGFGNHPVTEVSWYGATAFADYYGYYLPTEEQWQGVADYDGTYLYSCGTSIDHSKANYSGSAHPFGTTAVGSFGQYGYGMSDMAGNVREWTSSPSGDARVIRDGCWFSSYSLCTVSVKWTCGPGWTDGHIGFRVCR